MSTSKAQEDTTNLNHEDAMGGTNTAFVQAHWENLPQEMQETMLSERLRLLRWMKRLLRARIPEMNDALATIASAQVATKMFGKD